jgi:hypothetical protein
MTCEQDDQCKLEEEPPIAGDISSSLHNGDSDNSNEFALRYSIFRTNEAQAAERTLFDKVIQSGLTYPCSCCHQLHFRKSVLKFDANKYSEDVALEWIFPVESMSGDNYVCKRCHNCLRKSVMPALCVANKLQLREVPFEVAQLNEVGERLVSLTYPFMKILKAPKCQRSKVKGPVITVPVGVRGIEDTLPRTANSSGLILLQLRRKQQFEHCYLQRFVNVDHVNSAIVWLKSNNPLYSTVNIKTISNDNNDGNLSNAPKLQCIIDEKSSANIAALDESNEDTEERRTNHCFVMRELDMADPDCLPPTNSDTQPIVSVAPAEGLHLVSILSLANTASLLQECFPKCIPYGDFGFNVDRPVKLSKTQLIRWCLCNHDPRFAQSTDLVFLAQYLREAEALSASVRVQLRKAADGHVTAADARRSGFSDDVMINKLGYRFMAQVRGSPAFWQRTMYDALAMVRQQGKPTWFVTFSCADLYWREIIKSIAYQYGTKYSDEEVDGLSYADRCNWINRNVVTAVRMAEFKFHTLLNSIIYGKSSPLGKVIHHFFRAEDQNRCCLHWHGILWVDGAPQLGIQSDEEICQFIDQHITVHVPDDNASQLNSLVKSRQVHHHTSTCLKQLPAQAGGGTTCRFHYPKEASERTYLQRHQLLTNTDAYKSKKITDKDIPISVVMQRNTGEEMINPYSPHLLLTWQANIDVQFITNEYAVINYILGYMCKAEREVTEKIKAALTDAMKEVSSRSRLVKMLNSFVQARVWSDHMAAALATGTPLVYKDVQVIYMPSGLPEGRTRLLLPRASLENREEASTDIFCKNLLDHYADRPRQLADLCLAEFASLYSVGQCSSRQNDNGDSSEEEVTGKKPNLQSNIKQFI